MLKYDICLKRYIKKIDRPSRTGNLISGVNPNKPNIKHEYYQKMN